MEMGLVQSLAQPGGNVTGVTNRTGELGGKRLELLKEVVPRLSSVTVLYEPANPSSVLDLQQFSRVRRVPLKLMIFPLELRTGEDFDKAFSAKSTQHSDSLYVSAGALMNTNRKRIVAFHLGAVYRRYTAEKSTSRTVGSFTMEPILRPVIGGSPILLTRS